MDYVIAAALVGWMLALVVGPKRLTFYAYEVHDLRTGYHIGVLGREVYRRRRYEDTAAVVHWAGRDHVWDGVANWVAVRPGADN